MERIASSQMGESGLISYGRIASHQLGSDSQLLPSKRIASSVPSESWPIPLERIAGHQLGAELAILLME